MKHYENVGIIIQCCNQITMHFQYVYNVLQKGVTLLYQWSLLPCASGSGFGLPRSPITFPSLSYIFFFTIVNLSFDDLTCAERRGPFFWACSTASWSSVWTPRSTCSKSWGPCIRADRPSSEWTNSLQWPSISAMLAKQPRITLRQ